MRWCLSLRRCAVQVTGTAQALLEGQPGAQPFKGSRTCSQGHTWRQGCWEAWVLLREHVPASTVEEGTGTTTCVPSPNSTSSVHPGSLMSPPHSDRGHLLPPRASGTQGLVSFTSSSYPL